MAAFGSLAFIATGLGFFGLSQWMAGLSPTMLWSLPICAVLALPLYLSGFLGFFERDHEVDAFLR